MRCRKCGKEVTDDSRFCKFCGYDFLSASESDSKPVIESAEIASQSASTSSSNRMLVVIAVLSLIGGFLYFFKSFTVSILGISNSFSLFEIMQSFLSDGFDSLVIDIEKYKSIGYFCLAALLLSAAILIFSLAGMSSKDGGRAHCIVCLVFSISQIVCLFQVKDLLDDCFYGAFGSWELTFTLLVLVSVCIGVLSLVDVCANGKK